MSTTLNEVSWALVGNMNIPTFMIRNSLRIFSTTANGANFSYLGTAYNAHSFSVGSTSASFGSITTYPISNRYAAFPQSSSGSSFAFQNFNGIYFYHQSTLYTVRTNTNLTLEGFDATEGSNNDPYIAYTQNESSITTLRWGRFDFVFTFNTLNPGGSVSNVITGTSKVRLSRNGFRCCVYNNTTIKVYAPTTASFVQNTQFVQIGANIVVPTAFSDVVINNDGTRILVRHSKLVSFYELSSGQWVLRNTFSPPLTSTESIESISINADGSILLVRTSSKIFTYSYLNSSYYEGSSFLSLSNGESVTISLNSAWLAANSFNGTSDFVGIYRSTITTVTYDVPVITLGQSFTITQNIAFSRSLAMLNDGLNRTVTSWSATGLPTGISINSTTGQITGTTSASGQFTASITAENPDGSDTEAVQFTVQRALPVFDGAIRATAIYAGATQAMALYRGSQKLWP